MPDVLDFTKGNFIPCLLVEHDEQTGAGEVVATMPVAQLLELVLDPKASENPKRVAEDPRLKKTAELRSEVQRAVEGAKERNAQRFADYLVDGYEGKYPTMVPAITLYHPEPLDLVDLGGGLKAVILPFGDSFVCLDGETQRIAQQEAAKRAPGLIGKRVKVVIHFGKSVSTARQGFYDLNTREVKPNAAVAISMDTLDPATRITRELIEASDVLRSHGVNKTRRQLRSTDSEILTVSALRTGVVTAMFGSGGLAVGNRTTADRLEGLDDEAIRALSQSVVAVWSAILSMVADVLPKRAETVVGAPAVLAGIGIVAHHAVTAPYKKVEAWSIEQVLEQLRDVDWSRLRHTPTGMPSSPWDGICGKLTPSGAFSVGGPKEVGHAVAEALERRNSAQGQRIRR